MSAWSTTDKEATKRAWSAPKELRDRDVSVPASDYRRGERRGRKDRIHGLGIMGRPMAENLIEGARPRASKPHPREGEEIDGATVREPRGGRPKQRRKYHLNRLAEVEEVLGGEGGVRRPQKAPCLWTEHDITGRNGRTI